MSSGVYRTGHSPVRAVPAQCLDAPVPSFPVRCDLGQPFTKSAVPTVREEEAAG
jgi:hypothetical protein